MKDTSKNSSLDYMKTNYLGTLNLAKQAANFGVKRFIFKFNKSKWRANTA